MHDDIENTSIRVSIAFKSFQEINKMITTTFKETNFGQMKTETIAWSYNRTLDILNVMFHTNIINVQTSPKFLKIARFRLSPQ